MARSARYSFKGGLVTQYGLWMMHEGLISTVAEFKPISAKLMRLRTQELVEEIKRRKQTGEVK